MADAQLQTLEAALQSHTRKSPLPILLRWSGPALSAAYGLGVTIHRSLSKPRFAPIPTICVGNLTAGGTGKTPAVICLARLLTEKGFRPAILMRGYKAQGGDEAEEVKAALDGLNVPVLLGSDRLNSAREACKLGCDVALLDDGFQHWRLARDLDIVLVDATDPFGGGKLLPHGYLREPASGLARAGVVIVTRAEHLSGAGAKAELARRISALAPDASIFFAQHRPASVRRLQNETEVWTLDRLRGLRAVAVCGIGNPPAFAATLQRAGVDIADFIALDDHHIYTQNELGDLNALVSRTNAAAVIVTGKDAVKIEGLHVPRETPWLALRVEFCVDDAAAFWTKMEIALREGQARVKVTPRQ